MTDSSRPLTFEAVRRLQLHRNPTEHTAPASLPQPPFPNIPTRRLTKKDLMGRDVRAVAAGHIPSGAELIYEPSRSEYMPRRTIKAKDKELRPLNIYPPDRRYTFYSTDYPWRTLGRVSGRLAGAGVLVGPRHLLTASHLVQWNGDNTAGAVQFAPMYHGGTLPFGTANAQLTYSYRKVGDNANDADVAEDYVVCVLDQRLGDRLGWMGAKTYTEDWDDGTYWAHVGYSADLGGGQLPSFQNQISFEDADHPGPIGFIIDIDSGDGLDIETETASVTHGDSGGPFFGWWDGESYPSVVAVMSAEGYLEQDNDNWAGGGSPMVHLILQARAEYP